MEVGPTPHPAPSSRAAAELAEGRQGLTQAARPRVVRLVLAFCRQRPHCYQEGIGERLLLGSQTTTGEQPRRLLGSLRGHTETLCHRLPRKGRF